MGSIIAKAVAFFSLVGVCSAQVAIDAPKQVSIGERCILSATGAENAVLHWELLSGDSEQILVFDDGLKAAFFTGSTSATHTFLLIAANVSGDGEITIETARHSITVIGGDVTPTPDPPTPKPPIPPPTDIPDGKLGLTKLAYRIAKSVPQEHRPAASALAIVYRTTATGEVPSIEVLINATRKSTRSLLTEDEIKAWTPGIVAIGKAIEQLVVEGKLALTVEDHRAAWLAIADGLERAK